MKGTIDRYHRVLLVVTGVVTAVTATLSSPATALAVAQTRAVHTVADRTDGHDNSDNGNSKEADKSDSTRGGPHRKSLMDTDLTRPGAVVNDLTSPLLSANRQIVQSDYHPVDPGHTSDLEVSCPAPFQVVNGGEQNDGDDVQLTASYPVVNAAGTAWHVQVHNGASNQPASYRAVADCINGLTQYQRVTHPDQEVGTGAVDGDEVPCPAGTLPLGGGYSIETDGQVAINDSYVFLYGNTWRVDWRNIGSSPARISTYAMCAAGVVAGSGLEDQSTGTQEYERVEESCAAPNETLAGGWRSNDNRDDTYVVVTDSYPTPDDVHVVWAHQHNGATFGTYVMCGTVP